ncbi:MAG TPA: alkaline phosphatase family protein [Pyrinomonadaceae bacterium]|nr:alkaline phosphatase family protein [Pyrinomonadaceae bacterium]
MTDSCSSHRMVRALARHEELPPQTDAELRRLAARQTRPRRLLLCLDGVPLEVINAAKTRGLFDNFGEPARLLSPFPTLTNVALSQMLGATPPLGYESLYFDREAKELRGGARKYVGRRTPDKVPSSYMDELDYQEPLAFEFLIYVAPETIWRADMRRFRERFRAAPQHRDFFAFLKGTDGLLHIRGPERLQVALESLDRILRGIQEVCGRETEIVLFSDHGMNLEENRRIHLQTHLQRAGFELTGRLRDARAKGLPRLAAPAFGLCGYAAVYCAEETNVAQVAAALNTLEGVDFSVRRDEEALGVVVEGAVGRARIRRRETTGGVSFAYEPADETSDPLMLAPVVRSLAETGRLDAQGFAPDSAWLEATAAHIYPDALANLYESLHAPRVRHTADLLVSLRDGYYYGASVFSRLVRLAATHGNALRASSSAFLMSTHRDFPSYVRASEARPLLRE